MRKPGGGPRWGGASPDPLSGPPLPEKLQEHNVMYLTLEQRKALIDALNQTLWEKFQSSRKHTAIQITMNDHFFLFQKLIIFHV